MKTLRPEPGRSNSASAEPAQDKQGPSTKRIIAAGMAGTIIEYFDFLIYATVAGLVFGDLFFPNEDPFVSSLLAWGTFAVSYFARPIGGLVFGHFGDKLGRTRMLYITLLMMGISTIGIGILPTYGKIGILAPIILVLLRLIQGIGVGGEYGGAALLMIEHSHNSGRRGLWGALTTGSSSIGFLLATAMMAFLTSVSTPEQFQAWVWRVPFIVSALMLVVAFYIRRNITETPLMEKTLEDENDEKPKVPLIELIRNNPRHLLIALAAPFGNFAAYYVVLVFSVPYVAGLGDVDRSFLLTMATIAQVFYVFFVVFGGYLSDTVGRRITMTAGAAILASWIFAFFPLLKTGSVGGTLVAFTVALAGVGLMVGPMAAFLAELFDTKVRYSGLSIGYQFSAAIAGGLSPLLATVLIHDYNSWVPVAIMVTIANLISLTAIVFAHDRSRESID